MQVPTAIDFLQVKEVLLGNEIKMKSYHEAVCNNYRLVQFVALW